MFQLGFSLFLFFFLFAPPSSSGAKNFRGDQFGEINIFVTHPETKSGEVFRENKIREANFLMTAKELTSLYKIL